jgi:hypothetical protein
MTPRDTRRKALGAWQTPAWLAEHLTRAALARLESPATARVLDPACGEGAFLAAAVRAGVAESQVLGVDLDPVAVAAARQALPGVEVRQGDALGGALKGLSFELVLGNPPWVSYSGRQAERRGRGRGGTEGWPAAHAEFLEQAVTRWSTRLVALVLPAQVGHLAGYAALRERVVGTTGLVEARAWGEGVFAGVVAPVMTVLLDRAHRGPSRLIGWDGAVEERQLHGGEAWIRPQVDADGLLERMARRGRSLGALVADCGVHTGNCSAKLLCDLESDGGVVFAPVLEGRDVTRYACSPPRRALRLDLVPGPGEYFTVKPAARYRLAEFLIRQTGDRPIVGPRLGADHFRNSLLALLPPQPGSPWQGVDLRFVVGLLNSALIGEAWRRLVPESRQRTFPQVKIRDLRRLPVFLPDLTDPAERAAHDALVHLVQARLDGAGGEVERGIEALVRRLYGLGPNHPHPVGG